MSFQIGPLKRRVITLNASVLILVAVCFHVSLQITNTGWFIITLVAFLSHFQMNLKIFRERKPLLSLFKVWAVPLWQSGLHKYAILVHYSHNNLNFHFSTHLTQKKVKVLFIQGIIVMTMTLSNWVGGTGTQGNPFLWKNDGHRQGRYYGRGCSQLLLAPIARR